MPHQLPLCKKTTANKPASPLSVGAAGSQPQAARLFVACYGLARFGKPLFADLCSLNALFLLVALPIYGSNIWQRHQALQSVGAILGDWTFCKRWP